MSERKWTAEPWSIVPAATRHCFTIQGDNGTVLFDGAADWNGWVDFPDHDDLTRIVASVNALSGIADPETWVTMCKELTAFMSRASTENNDDPVRLLIRAIHAAENGTK